jgi:hypothetical protein
MFGSSLVIGHDILDIGSHKFDANRTDQRAIGSGAMIPTRLALGEPGQFDVPNVPDVSVQHSNHPRLSAHTHTHAPPLPPHHYVAR